MSRNTKIILGIVGGLILLCICAVVGGLVALRYGGEAIARNLTTDDPAAAAAAAGEMVDYTLPAGYQEQASVNILVGQMVMIHDGTNLEDTSGRPVILFLQLSIPSGTVDPDQMRAQMQQSMRQSMQRNDFELQLVDQQDTTIRGQDVTLFIYEGENGDGLRIRQVMSDMFEGKSGSLFLLMTGAVDAWDQAEIDAFISSIR
jgi:hypothetical protein